MWIRNNRRRWYMGPPPPKPAKRRRKPNPNRKHRRKKRPPPRKLVRENRGHGNMTRLVRGDDVLVGLTEVAEASRPQYVRLIWQYIKQHNLQKEGDGRIIIPDQRLSRLMGEEGKEINAFTMMRYLEQHFLKD